MKERPILLFVVDIFTRKGRKNFDIHLYFFFFFIVSQLFILSHFLQHYIGYLYFQFNRTSLFYFIYICIYFLDSIIFSNCQFSFKKSKRQRTFSSNLRRSEYLFFHRAFERQERTGEKVRKSQMKSIHGRPSCRVHSLPSQGIVNVFIPTSQWPPFRSPPSKRYLL